MIFIALLVHPDGMQKLRYPTNAKKRKETEETIHSQLKNRNSYLDLLSDSSPDPINEDT